MPKHLDQRNDADRDLWHQHHHHHHHHNQTSPPLQQPQTQIASSSSFSSPSAAVAAATADQQSQLIGQRNHGDRQASPPSTPPIQLLSKLVLSTSLHQLAGSKFYTNTTAANHTNAAADETTNAQRTTPATRTTYSIMNEPNRHLQSNSNPTTTTNPHGANNIAHSSLDPSGGGGGGVPKIDDEQSTTTTTMMMNEKLCKQNNQPPSSHHHQTSTNDNNKQSQREANLDTLHVVVGSEACDLDSAVSCLLMFHIISKMADEIAGKEGQPRTLYIPLLNTTREMLDSKSEVLWFLQKTLSIDKTFLFCKDDINWVDFKKNGVEVLVTLVDHNYNDEFKDIGRIVEIIDHHQVQNPQWLMENQASIRLTLDTTVGSCTTLVAERLFYIHAEHHIADEILLLIYGTVLLDTICLSEKAKRFTRRDVYLLKKLDSLLGNKKPIRDVLYKELVEVKNSTRGDLNFEKLMKRDLKVYKDKNGMRVGIASLFGMGAREALGLAANIDLDQFFRENQYEAFIIMGLIADLDHSDSISRDLVLISANGHLFDQLCAAFELDTSKLDLVPISGSDSQSPDPEDNIINNRKIQDSSSAKLEPNTTTNNSNNSPSHPIDPPLYKARIWLQRNVTSSRKVIAPLVLKVLHDGAH